MTVELIRSIKKVEEVLSQYAEIVSVVCECYIAAVSVLCFCMVCLCTVSSQLLIS